MRVTIWGCRGSIPAPGPETVNYGGNTSSIEVLLDNGAVLVLDAGTGIRDLGAALQERGTRRIHLLLTHLHLDHLEGLRFFAPLFDERATIDVWGPSSPVQSLRERIRRSFSPPLFPIDLHEIPARLAFHDVPKEPWTLEGATLTSALVMHPGPTVGFRIEADGATVAYIPDHEPALTGDFASRSRDWISGASLSGDADVLLHDAQFFEDEYADADRVGSLQCRQRRVLRKRGRCAATRPLPPRPGPRRPLAGAAPGRGRLAHRRALGAARPRARGNGSGPLLGERTRDYARSCA